jgi:hypothetical protein
MTIIHVYALIMEENACRDQLYYIFILAMTIAHARIRYLRASPTIRSIEKEEKSEQTTLEISNGNLKLPFQSSIRGGSFRFATSL